MSTALPPGIGNSQQAMQATAFMRDQPWYQAQLKQWGLTPNAQGDTPLNDQQRQQVLSMARQNGIGISDKYEINPNGQIAEPDSHWLRNTLIAAAIGGSMFIPGVSEALMSGLSSAGGALGIGGGGAAGGSGAAAGAAAGTLPSSVIGSGFIPAIEGGTGLAAEAGGTAAAMSSPLLDMGMDLPSTTIGSGAMPGIAGGAGTNVSGPGGLLAAMQSGDPTAVQKLMSGMKNPSNLANLGSLLGSMSSGEKANRVSAAQMLDAYNKDMISAQTARDQDESSSLQKLAQTGYILNGHQGYTPGSITLNGQQRQLPDFGAGFTAPTDAQKSGAAALQAQLGPRLAPGGTYTPIKPQTDPGTMENIGSYGATGLGLAGGIMNMFNPQSDSTDYSKIGKTFMSYFGNK